MYDYSGLEDQETKVQTLSLLTSNLTTPPEVEENDQPQPAQGHWAALAPISNSKKHGVSKTKFLI